MSLIPDIKLKNTVNPYYYKEGGTPIWSFRSRDGENVDRLGIIPDDHFNFNKDISIKMIFGYDNNTAEAKKDCTLDDILNLIPAI
jgi:hypothetical protein